MHIIFNQATFSLLLIFAAVPWAARANCCSHKFKTCDGWCGNTEAECKSCGGGDLVWIDPPTNSCIERWGVGCNSNSDCCFPGFCAANNQCMYDPNVNPQPSPTPPPVSVPSPTPPTTIPPVSPTWVPTHTHSNFGEAFSTKNTMTSFEALLRLNDLKFEVEQDPPTYSIVAEGGAAGNDVVSEGQGYALLISGIVLASAEPNDPNRDSMIDIFYGYFNGWKKMAELSSINAGNCQSTKFCASGSIACLPGWKFPKELNGIIGSGSAPDGDVDAITGMVFGVQAVADDATKPVWFEEVRQWADASATQFMYHETVASSTGENRIVKLGSCWGGWDSNGNNPSYHSPGSYRIMRDYQANFSGRDYIVPNFGDGLSIKERWNKLISTSYKYLEVSQCANVGIVPNWATVSENSSDGSLLPQTTAFSGSGTPQYEFGSEASRTLWRVAFDGAVYPCEAESASNFLAPIHNRLGSNFDPNAATGSPWPENTLTSCKAFDEQPENITPMNDWIWIQFMYAPVYSTLIVPASGITDTEQQAMVDAAGSHINNGLEAALSYYHRSWSIIGILTLNGAIEKASEVLDKPSCGSPLTNIPTKAPVGSVTTPSPSKKPTATPEGCFSNNYKDCMPESFVNRTGSCNTIWLPTGSQSNCIALWQECIGQTDGCCGPAECFEDGNYAVCVPLVENP